MSLTAPGPAVGAPRGTLVQLSRCNPEEPQLTSPLGPDGIDRGMLADVANRLFGKSARES